MPWHPPIPAEAVYSPEVAQLGAGLRLLWYLYNSVERDGRVSFSPKRAQLALSVPYETVRNWWQAIRESRIVTVELDKGKNGYILRFGDDWLDWHVMAANYGDVQRSNMPVETQEKPASTEFQRSNTAAQIVEPSFNGFSTEFQRSNMPVEDPAYKVLIDSESPPPPPPTQPPRANAAGAAGGGGEAAQESTDPVYAVFANPRYGINEAQRLAHQWAGQDAEQVAQLVERLYSQHHDPSNPRYTGGRLYRALKAGPGVLLKPPPAAASARPIYTPPTRATPTDPDAMRRALAAARTKARDPVET